jgi:hypothetical protein
MQLDITKQSYKSKWYNFETDQEVDEPGDQGVFLKIRPRLLSKSNVVIRDGDMILTGKDQCEYFKQDLEDWRGITGPDEQPLPCTNEVKQVIYDFQMNGIPGYVARKAWGRIRAIEAQEKNS